MSTTEGHLAPLLEPEAALFPRHFYAASSSDSKSILGARPLFCMTSKRHSHGFESALMHARMRTTDASSSTSTDPKLTSCCFDELGNLALNGVHSRDVFCHGFVVDNTSGCGMSTRHKSNDLNESIDSHVMVRNLAMSQKYIKWTIF